MAAGETLGLLVAHHAEAGVGGTLDHIEHAGLHCGDAVRFAEVIFADDVPSKGALEGLADGEQRSGKSHAVEFLHHLAGAEHREHALLASGTAVVAQLHCHGAEVFGALQEFLIDTVNLLFGACLFLGSLALSHLEDVAHEHFATCGTVLATLEHVIGHRALNHVGKLTLLEREGCFLEFIGESVGLDETHAATLAVAGAVLRILGCHLGEISTGRNLLADAVETLLDGGIGVGVAAVLEEKDVDGLHLLAASVVGLLH